MPQPEPDAAVGERRRRQQERWQRQWDERGEWRAEVWEEVRDAELLGADRVTVEKSRVGI